MRGAIYLHAALQAHVALIALAAALGVAAWRKRALPLFPALFLVGWIGLWSAYIVAVGGDHFPMFRFFLPVLPALILFIGVAWSALLLSTTRGARVAFVSATVLAFVGADLWSWSLDGTGATLQPRLSASWAAVGHWIDRNTPADTLVATNVIGAVGFFSRRPVLDMLGLVDTTIARGGKVHSGSVSGHARYDSDYVYARAPDLVVYPLSGRQREPFARAPFEELYDFALYDFVADPRCAERYEHVAVPLSDGTWLEMQRKRAFPIPRPYEVHEK
jgi:hypothetical protein